MDNKNKRTAIIIDVREPKEYRENHLHGAINIPSTQFEVNQFEPYRSNVICLICQTGKRASAIEKKLTENDFKQVILLDKHMDNVSHKIKNNSWSVDRQFRMLLGLLLAIFLIGFYFGISFLIFIPIILSTGLIITSIIDKCYMRMGIAMLPWNKHK
ncbi:hypothetical protein DNU06_02450 [Putridiphycobacter roseus]|uniref:Rhodanese domain-containing protein n=1 Tax=Putridiphycobacter roseus TaxID=2219161 RepID=A0A2W1N247_9FLAO|nr:rhodanese-like domain-containing protein [Putridiphycobacter roseus]PZE18709.1 hypothetical protein DNU06_02450 [Putridiphycobacter roseus]